MRICCDFDTVYGKIQLRGPILRGVCTPKCSNLEKIRNDVSHPSEATLKFRKKYSLRKNRSDYDSLVLKPVIPDPNTATQRTETFHQAGATPEFDIIM